MSVLPVYLPPGWVEAGGKAQGLARGAWGVGGTAGVVGVDPPPPDQAEVIAPMMGEATLVANFFSPAMAVLAILGIWFSCECIGSLITKNSDVAVLLVITCLNPKMLYRPV